MFLENITDLTQEDLAIPHLIKELEGRKGHIIFKNDITKYCELSHKM